MFDVEERVFAALADSTRRQLLTLLAESSPKTSTQLAQEFPITRQGIEKHLNLLAQAELVRAQIKGREKHYWFSPTPLNSVRTWMDAISAKWETRLRRLKDLVESDEDL